MSSNQKAFHIGSFLSLSKTHEDLIFKILEACGELGYSVSITTNGNGAKCLDLGDKYKNIKILEDIPKNKTNILGKIDVIIIMDKPSQAELKIILGKGIVPIISNGNGFVNFDPQTESGNAFIYKKDNFWDMVRTIIRAAENHKFTYDWRNLQKNIQEIATSM